MAGHQRAMAGRQNAMGDRQRAMTGQQISNPASADVTNSEKKRKNTSAASGVAPSTPDRVLPVSTARGAGKRAAGHRLAPSGCEVSSP